MSAIREVAAPIPTTDAEAHNFARADVELADRVAILEQTCRDLVAALAAVAPGTSIRAFLTYPDQIRERAEEGPGLAYARRRMEMVGQGRWGADSILDEIARRKQIEIDRGKALEAEAEAKRREWNEAVARHARALGAKTGHGHLILEWRRDLKDPDGRKRHALAVERARAELAAKNNPEGGGDA